MERILRLRSGYYSLNLQKGKLSSDVLRLATNDCHYFVAPESRPTKTCLQLVEIPRRLLLTIRSATDLSHSGF